MFTTLNLAVLQVHQVFLNVFLMPHHQQGNQENKIYKSGNHGHCCNYVIRSFLQQFKRRMALVHIVTTVF